MKSLEIHFNSKHSMLVSNIGINQQAVDIWLKYAGVYNNTCQLFMIVHMRSQYFIPVWSTKETLCLQYHRGQVWCSPSCGCDDSNVWHAHYLSEIFVKVTLYYTVYTVVSSLATITYFLLWSHSKICSRKLCVPQY